jgi:hypothetical protein
MTASALLPGRSWAMAHPGPLRQMPQWTLRLVIALTIEGT